MWIMLMFRIASACVTGQGWRSTSSSKGGRDVVGAGGGAPGADALQVRGRRIRWLPAKRGESRGRRRPRVHQCRWRSRGRGPVGGKTRRSTSRMGSRLRSVAAACRPPVGTGCGSKKGMTSTVPQSSGGSGGAPSPCRVQYKKKPCQGEVKLGGGEKWVGFIRRSIHILKGGKTNPLAPPNSKNPPCLRKEPKRGWGLKRGKGGGR